MTQERPYVSFSALLVLCVASVC